MRTGRTDVEIFGRTTDLVLGYAAVAALFLATRLPLVWRFPVHFDEATFAQWTLNGYENRGTALFQALANGNQPLLEWLGIAWMQAGVEPVTALRLVSLVAGGLTLTVVAVFATRLYGAGTGLLAGALYAIVPFTLLYSVLGLYDPLATFFIAAAMLLEYELARRPRLDLSLLLGLVFAGAVLTKLTAYSVMYLVPVSALVFDWRRAGLPRRLSAWIGGLTVAFSMAWVATRVLQLSEYADDLSQARQQLSKHSFATAMQDPGRWIGQNWPAYRDELHVYLTTPFVIAAAIGIALLLRNRWTVGLYFVLWILVPLGGLVLLASTPFGRWLVIIAPPLVVLVAAGLVEAIRWACGLVDPGRRRLLAIAVAVIAVLPALVFDARLIVSPTQQPLAANDDVDYITGYAAGTAWNAVATELRRLSGGRPIVVATGPFCCGSLPLVLRHEPAVSLVRAEETDSPSALYAIENGPALPQRAEGLSWRRVWTYRRPRNGRPVALYESGVVYDLEFASTPDELRAAIGGSDADYDAHLGAHPAVKSWADSWYAAHPSAGARS